MGSDLQTPTKASIPSWALNPDYEVHATTSKTEQTERRPVFEIFTENPQLNTNLAIPSTHEAARSTRTRSEPPNSKRNSTNSTTTKL